jgi:putative ABC transport system permease protein
MSPLAFAWRSLTREPARGVLGLAGVAIVGALLFDMLLLSRGLVLSFREILRSTGFDMRVTATKGLPGSGPPIENASRAVEDLSALPEIARVARVRFGTASAWEREHRSPVRVSVLGTSGALRDWKILEGEDLSSSNPSGPPQIVVNEPLARAFDLVPGSELVIYPGMLRESVLPNATFRVVGIAEFPFEARGQAAAKISIDAYRAAGIGPDRDEADMLLVSARDPASTAAAVQAMRRARPDLHSFSIEDLLEHLRTHDFTYFRQISFVLSSITAFFACLLVTTILTVSVNQRLGEIAALRALGFSRTRISLDLLAEAAVLLGAGGLLALPLGALVAWVLDSILRQLPGLPVQLHFFAADPRAAAVLAAILAGSALLAAAYPVWIASRLPIAATLRKEVVS